MPLQAQGPEKILSCHVRNVPFSEFCDLVFQQTGVTIYYQENRVKSLSVTLDSDSITVMSAMKKILSGSGLETSAWHDNLVILQNARLISELPVYKQISEQKDTVFQKEPTITESEERYMTGRKPGVIQTITIGRSGTKLDNNKAKILGRVLDEETGEPISFVTIFITQTKTGALTDINGFFTFALSVGNTMPS